MAIFPCGCTFTADAAWTLPAAFVPAGPHRRDEAVEETHHVLWRAQSCGVLLQNTLQSPLEKLKLMTFIVYQIKCLLMKFTGSDVSKHLAFYITSPKLKDNSKYLHVTSCYSVFCSLNDDPKMRI